MKNRPIVIFILLSIQTVYAGIASEVGLPGKLIGDISHTPVFTLQLSHIIIIAVLLSLLSIITIQSRRFKKQRLKQYKHERIAATKTAELYRKYRLVLRANHTIVWTWNLEEKTIECECDRCREVGRYWTYNISEDIFYSRVHPDDKDRVREKYEELKTGKITVFQEEFRYRYLHVPVAYNWVESFAIVGDSSPEGGALTFVGGMVTITERKELELNAKKKEQAEVARRMKSAFLSSVRHEIRTPLNAIVGFSNLLANSPEQEEAIEYSKIIQYNSALLAQIVDDVLDMSDIESGQIELKYYPVNIVEMFQSLEQVYRYRVAKNVQLSCDTCFGALLVVTDGYQLRHMLNNLLSNACKFTSSGSITFGYKPIEDGLYIYVTDTGIGIAEENRSYVFDQFAKFDNFTQGVGMGLAVCRSIVQKMKGEIGVESELGKGSTFWFKIPCRM